jgi:hypothetical protein
MLHILANVIWQSNGWTGVQEKEVSAFKWVDRTVKKRNRHIPGEAQNFDFDHRRNRKGRVYGYFEPGWGYCRQYMDDASSQGRGIVFFCSTRPEGGRWIVGAFGKATVLEYKDVPYSPRGINVCAPGSFAAAFNPSAYVPLSRKYSGKRRFRYFTYINDVQARRLIRDAIAFHVWQEHHGNKTRGKGNGNLVVLRRLLSIVNSGRSGKIHPRCPPMNRTLNDGVQSQFDEGARYISKEWKIERNPSLIKQKKALSNLRCEVCELSFGERYGDHGRGFIICHHKRPLAARAKRSMTSLNDLAVVCANCHQMLHRGKRVLSLEQLRSVMRS